MSEPLAPIAKHVQQSLCKAGYTAKVKRRMTFYLVDVNAQDGEPLATLQFSRATSHLVIGLAELEGYRGEGATALQSVAEALESFTPKEAQP